ncbi:hypothetical protein D9M68_100230 [compost metagenome]
MVKAELLVEASAVTSERMASKVSLGRVGGLGRMAVQHSSLVGDNTVIQFEQTIEYFVPQLVIGPRVPTIGFA